MTPKALIIVSTLYNAREIWGLLKVLRNNDIGAEVISLKEDCVIQDEEGPQTMKIHGTIQDFDLAQISEFDVLCVVSGALKETMAHWTNEKVQTMVVEFDRQEKFLAAICCSVPAIREACRDKKVAFFPLRPAQRLMKEVNAISTHTSVMYDGRTITAEHQVATKLWAQTLSEMVNGQEPEYVPKFGFNVDKSLAELKARKKIEEGRDYNPLAKKKDVWNSK